MNIHELSNRTGIGLKSLRKLDKLGVLKIDALPQKEEHPRAAELRFVLMRRQPLTAAQLIALYDEPELFFDLGKYEARAREQYAALGSLASAELAPGSVTAAIADAAKGDKSACQMLARWLMATLPAGAVSHHWIAVRLLAPLNGYLREQYSKSVNIAMLNVRKLPEFAGHWRSEKIGTRNQIRYYSLDL